MSSWRGTRTAVPGQRTIGAAAETPTVSVAALTQTVSRLPRRQRLSVRNAAHAGAVAAFLLGVFVLGVTAVRLRPEGSAAAPWWPAAGLSVAVLCLVRADRRLWYVAGVALASGAANYAGGRTLTVSVCLGLSNALEGGVASWLLTRGVPGRPHLATLGDLWRLVCSAAVGALLCGVGAGVTFSFLLDGDLWVTLWSVTASHGAAVLTIVPMALQAPTHVRRRPAEGVLQWTALLVVSVYVFSPSQMLPLAFLPMPLLVWGALRLGVRTVSVQLLAVGAIALVMTVEGGGPFASSVRSGAVSPGTTVSLVQVFMVACALVVLPLAVALAQRRAALARVSASEELFRHGFSEALLGMLLLRRCEDGLEIVELNAVAARILSGTVPDLVGTSWSDHLGAADRAVTDAAVVAMLAGAEPGWHGEVSLTAGHSRRWLEIALSPLPGRGGADLPGEVLTAQVVDITARREAERALSDLALHDGLTGLANRMLLRDRLEHALSSARRDNGDVALLFIDLDDFKAINDSAGHQAGDAVLVEVARLLLTQIRPGDTAARLGGDEFVVLCPGVSSPEAAEDIVRRISATLNGPVQLDSGTYQLGASVGHTLGNAWDAAEDLLRAADRAMYVVKSVGKQRSVELADEPRSRPRPRP